MLEARDEKMIRTYIVSISTVKEFHKMGKIHAYIHIYIHIYTYIYMYMYTYIICILYINSMYINNSSILKKVGIITSCIKTISSIRVEVF